MAQSKKTTGQLIAALPEEPRRLIGTAIIDGLREGRFTFFNPLATEGGDYTQSSGDYTQTSGGSHDQGSGGYTQTGGETLPGGIGRLDVTDLAEIMKSIESFER